MLRIVTSEVIVSSAVVFICSHRSHRTHWHIDTSAVSPDWTLGTFSILVSSISQKCSVLRGPEVAAAAQLRVMSLPWTNQRSVLWLCSQTTWSVDQSEVSITCAGRNFTCLRLISLSSRWPLSSTPGHRLLSAGRRLNWTLTWLPEYPYEAILGDDCQQLFHAWRSIQCSNKIYNTRQTNTI